MIKVSVLAIVTILSSTSFADAKNHYKHHYNKNYRIYTQQEQIQPQLNLFQLQTQQSQNIQKKNILSRKITMLASYYGKEMHGKNANGEKWNPYGLSAAHRTLPIGTRLEVCYRTCTLLVIKDRGPSIHSGREIDVSYGVAKKIGIIPVGIARITVRKV